MDVIVTSNDQLWSTDPVNFILLLIKVSLIIIGLLLNCFVLYVLFRGKIHFSDICTITIFANTLADLFLTLTFITSDILLPVYSREVAPFVCKFRRYIIHVSLTGELLMLSALALFHNDKLHMRTFGQAPCGVFIFPALIWFLALSCNIWSIVLYECQYTTYTLRNISLTSSVGPKCVSLVSAVSHLNTEAVFVPKGLIIETTVTIGIPLLIAMCLLIYVQNTTAAVTFRLKLAWILFIINALLVMPTIINNLIFAVLQSKPKTASMGQILLMTIFQNLQLVHHAIKPLFYFLLQTEIRKVICRFKIGRCFGFRATPSEVSIRLTPALKGALDSPTSSFCINTYSRNGSAISCGSEDISIMLQTPDKVLSNSAMHLRVASRM